MHVQLNRLAGATVILLLQIALVSSALAQNKSQVRSAPQDATHPTASLLDINNMTTWIERNAHFNWIDHYSHLNGSFPKGTGAGAVFAQGFVWGGIVEDGNPIKVRVNGSTYQSGMSPGKVLRNANGNVTGADDPGNRAKYHVWRVVSNWRQLEGQTREQFLRQSASQFFGVVPNDVTQAQMNDVTDQYDYDWDNWPADMGAPYDDVDGNGSYDPNVDIPGEPGASQTLWLVTNDLRPGVSEQSYGSPPIGLELQQTIWGYDFAASQALGNISFTRSRMIYTGLPNTPSNARIDSMFAVWWTDPDVGDHTNDYAGSDTTLSLGYAYNAETTDAVYNQFNLAPPAVGWDFLQGPINQQGDTLGMTAFVYFAAGSDISDPDLSEYSGTLQWFNLMRGMRPRPEYPAGDPFIDTITGERTKFALTGDPITGDGWIDGMDLPPGDRRTVQSSGPFTMQLGDTVDVVVGQVGALGTTNLSSVTVLKFYDQFAQFAYDEGFQLPSPPPTPTVSTSELDQKLVLDWGSDRSAVQTVENFNSQGFRFEGYNVYQLPTRTSGVRDGVKVATFDKENLVSVIIDNVIDEETGFVIQRPVQISPNTGLQRHLTITQDRTRQRPLANGVQYHFAVTSFSFLDTDDPDVPFRMLESPPAVLTLTPQPPKPGEEIPESATPQTALDVTQESGGSHANVTAEVVNPSQLVQGRYEVRFEFFNPATGETSPELAEGDTLTTIPSDLFEATEFSPENRLAVGDPFPLRWAVFRDGTRVSDWHPQVDPAGPVPASASPIVEGIQVHVPFIGGLSIGWDATGDRWITGVNWGGGLFFGGADIGENFFGSELPRSEIQTVEIDFAADTTSGPADGWMSRGKVYNRETGYAVAGTGLFPFAAYEVSPEGERRQVNVSIVEADLACGNLRWDLGILSDPSCTEDGLGNREYIFVHKSDYNEGADYDDTNWGPGADVTWAVWPAPRGDDPFLRGEFTLSFIRENPLTTADVFSFSVDAPTTGDPALAREQIKEINVFPNPYMGFSQLEASRFDKFVTFTHLPERATIRIFNLAGTMVRILEHDSPSQFERWDLTNQDNIPVASGVYIAHVDTEFGEKVLKLALVQEEQILQRY